MQPDPQPPQQPLNDELLRKVTKQLRTIKILLGIFFVMILSMLAVLAFVAVTVIAFTRDVSNRITNIQNQTTQSLDFKSKVCDNTTIKNFVNSNSQLCKD